MVAGLEVGAVAGREAVEGVEVVVGDEVGVAGRRAVEREELGVERCKESRR